jgi:hypothetical protein
MLGGLLDDVKNGSIEHETAKTMITAANAICNVVKTDIKVASHNGEKRKIKF